MDESTIIAVVIACYGGVLFLRFAAHEAERAELRLHSLREQLQKKQRSATDEPGDDDAFTVKSSGPSAVSPGLAEMN